jgi:hypothetical protein
MTDDRTTVTPGLRDAFAVVWQRQNVWSQAAGRAKRDLARRRAWVLGLTVAAAALGTLSAQLRDSAPPASTVLAIGAAVALALAPFLATRSGHGAVQAWTRMRAVAESLKADVYRYLAGVAPFDGADRDAVLLRRLDLSEQDTDTLVLRLDELTPAPRPRPPVHDVASYLAHRVDEQVTNYYRPAARQMARRAARLRRITVVLSGSAAALAAVAGVAGGAVVLAWVGVLTTVVTALTTYAATQRYETQQLEFSRTASQLERLRVGWMAGDAAADHTIVTASERIISISNAGWMAELIGQDTGTASPAAG